MIVMRWTDAKNKNDMLYTKILSERRYVYFAMFANLKISLNQPVNGF